MSTSLSGGKPVGSSNLALYLSYKKIKTIYLKVYNHDSSTVSRTFL
jgi:hypothetical protein